MPVRYSIGLCACQSPHTHMHMRLRRCHFFFHTSGWRYRKIRIMFPTRRGEIMTYILENEPMRGFYRLIEYARSGERERARYNIPLELRRAVQCTQRGVLPPPPVALPHRRDRYTFRPFMTLQSDQLIGSQGRRNMQF
jgi:hypothetical protein